MKKIWKFLIRKMCPYKLTKCKIFILRNSSKGVEVLLFRKSKEWDTLCEFLPKEFTGEEFLVEEVQKVFNHSIKSDRVILASARSLDDFNELCYTFMEEEPSDEYHFIDSKNPYIKEAEWIRYKDFHKKNVSDDCRKHCTEVIAKLLFAGLSTEAVIKNT